ncbi:hypothetical protein ACQEU6_21105 [Spirillospora sp. CA-108201]
MHPSEQLATPEGDRVSIDTEMIPLIRALWAIRLRTAGCCQDLGESILPAAAWETCTGRRRHAHFYTGQAWLKMPKADACAFLSLVGTNPVFRERLNRWTMPDAWDSYVYITADEDGASLSTWAQVHFPRTQIAEVTDILTQERATRNS